VGQYAQARAGSSTADTTRTVVQPTWQGAAAELVELVAVVRAGGGDGEAEGRLLAGATRALCFRSDLLTRKVLALSLPALGQTRGACRDHPGRIARYQSFRGKRSSSPCQNEFASFLG
jgi:hypothetical protein